MDEVRLSTNAVHHHQARAQFPEVPSVNPMPTLPPNNHSLNLQSDLVETEIRRDYIHDYYVFIAPKRRGRPYDTSQHDHPLVETADSPRLDLQPSTYEMPGPDGQWLVKVVANKYPALSITNHQAYGIQEIVIDTPFTNTAFGALPTEQIKNILLTYQQRSTSLRQAPNITYVSIFRNDGYEAGASLAHAHSQIIALPFVPPRISEESRTIEDFFTTKSRDPYDAIIEFEQKSKVRIIAEDESWICFSPYAPRWQMEAWILPKRAFSKLEDATDAEITDLAPHLKRLTSRLTKQAINYNLDVEQGISKHQRLVFKVRGRNVVSPQGGFELATDVIINVIPPEASTRWYRDNPDIRDLDHTHA